ncbi:MAG: hypothetical protein U0802_22770 [Candidatus Binatia bacterium]
MIGALAARRGRRASWASAALVGAVLVIAPWALRTARVAGRPVLGDTSAGFNLYQGALSADYVPARDFPPDGRAALAAGDEFARDRLLRARALEQIAAALGDYLPSRAAPRGVCFVHLVDPEVSWRPTRASLLALPVYVLAVFGGALLARRGERATVALVVALLAASVVTHALTVGMVRASLPYLPYLCLFATVGALAAARAVAGRVGGATRAAAVPRLRGAAS